MKNKLLYFVCGLSIFASSNSYAGDNLAKDVLNYRSKMDAIERLDKDKPKNGESIETIKGLTLDDFLALEEVQPGTSVNELKVLSEYDQQFNMPPNEAVKAINKMRKYGAEFPKEAIDDLRKDAKDVSKIIAKHSEKMEPSNVNNAEDIKKNVNLAKTNVEGQTGIPFKAILKKYKNKK